MLGDGDEVIVPGMTFVVGPQRRRWAVNATPVLVDIDPKTTWCIDVVAVEQGAITPRTQAPSSRCTSPGSVVGHLDWPLTALCQRRGVRLIEDCAHVARHVLARTRCRLRGGDFGSFSMQRVEIDDSRRGRRPDLQRRSPSGRSMGLRRLWRGVKDEWFYHHATLGTNLRMTEWQGAVLARTV